MIYLDNAATTKMNETLLDVIKDFSCERFYNASAVMFTASHNPPEYLGIKYIPDYAGPATDDITEQIVKNIGKELSDVPNGSIKTEFFFDKYFIKAGAVNEKILDIFYLHTPLCAYSVCGYCFDNIVFAISV